jgi:hypothetical protein
MATNHISKLIFCIAVTFFCFGTLKAQEADNAILQLIKEKQYVFTARSYTSNSYGTKQLTDYYSLKVTKDSIIVNLPYYGQSYTAQINLRDGGINFTSVKFDYTIFEKKKDKYIVTIKPKDDQSNIQELLLIIYSNGKTQLDVSSRNRELITLNGYISN